MIFVEDSNAFGQDGFTSSTTQVHELGRRAVTKDGRVFRYCSAGAVDTVPGKLYQSAAAIPNHLARTAPVVAVGATSFSFTPGNTAGAANLYAEGYLQVDTTPGQGYTYQVSGHAAITASVAFTLNLVPADSIQVALTASSSIGIVHNPFKNVILAPTTVTAALQGVAVAIITNSTSYGWLQTWGPCSTLIDGTPAIGTGLVCSPSVTGAVAASAAAAAEINFRQIGHIMQVGVDTKYNFVNLRLNP